MRTARRGEWHHSTDNRLFVEAVLYRYRAGIPWRDLPERFGDWKNTHLRFSRWAKSGVWKRVFEHLAADADNEYGIIDSTIVRAHQHSAGAQRLPRLTRALTMAATATSLMAASCSGAYAVPFTELGAGEVSCGAWTTDHEQSDQQNRYKAVQEEQWVVGFLTGVAATKAGEAVTYDRDSDPLAGINWDGVMKWISNYCATRPTNSVDSAAENFVLFRKRTAR